MRQDQLDVAERSRKVLPVSERTKKPGSDRNKKNEKKKKMKNSSPEVLEKNPQNFKNSRASRSPQKGLLQSGRVTETKGWA